jgi:hypothetical protein
MLIYPDVHAFVGGILSPRLEGRVDFNKYGMGCRELENMIATPTGGVYKRPGLRMVGKTKQATGVRLIPFDFNGTERQSYVIELGNGDGTTDGTGYARFFTQNSQLYADGVPFELPVSAITGLDLSLLSYVQSADVIYFTHPLMQPSRLERHAALTWAWVPLEFMQNTGWPLPFEEGNYPSKVRIYEDRLVYASTPKQPVNIWMSRTSEYLDFRINTASKSTDAPLPSDAIFLRLHGSRVNPIMWLLDMEQLVIGTNASEIRVMGSDLNAPLTPETAGHKRMSSYGSGPMQAILLGESAMFASRTGNAVYALDYQEFGYRFNSTQLNLLSTEVTNPGIAEMHSMLEPEPAAWFILSDGKLAGCTYVRSQNVYAWHRHETRGNIRSGAIIPYRDGDQLWLFVERETGGFVERMETPFDFRDEDATNNVFMDCFLSGKAAVDGRSIGMPHLAGETVQVVADGSYLGDFVVNNNGWVFSPKIKAGMYIVAGLPYEAVMQPMRPNYPMRVGQGVTFQKLVTGVLLRVLGSIGGEIRAEYDDDEKGEWQRIISFPHGATGGKPPKCRSENIHVPLSGNSTYDGLVTVRQTAPFPLYLVSLTYVIDQGG